MLLLELAIGSEHLHAVLLAVADIEQAIVRQRHTVHGATVLRQGVTRLVGALRAVIGLGAIGAPKLLDLAAVTIDDRHAPVLIAVGNIALVGLWIDEELRDASEIHRVVRTLVLALLTGLRHELAVLREFQDLRILGAVAAEPDEALVIDENPVHRIRPLVAVALAAPRADRVASRVER